MSFRNGLHPVRRSTSIMMVSVLLLVVAMFAGRFDHGSALPVVVLDAGHGGDELGATASGMTERDSNFDMAMRVRAILLDAHVDVVMTRMGTGRAEGLDTSKMNPDTITFADLQARVKRVDSANADVFISLHSNAFSDSTVRGVEAWYNAQRPFSDRNRAFADLLQTGIVAELQRAGFPAPPARSRDETGETDASGRTTPFFLLGPSRDVSRAELASRGVDPAALGMSPDAPAYRTAETDAPGVLLELLYLSNPQDVELLRNDTARSAMARGMAQAVLTFLKTSGNSPAAR